MKGWERKKLWFLKEAEITKHSEYMGNSLQSKLPMKIWNRYIWNSPSEMNPHHPHHHHPNYHHPHHKQCLEHLPGEQPPSSQAAFHSYSPLPVREALCCACTIIVIIVNRMLIDFFASWSNINEQGLPCCCFPSLALTCSATMILTIDLKIINIKPLLVVFRDSVLNM